MGIIQSSDFEEIRSTLQAWSLLLPSPLRPSPWPSPRPTPRSTHLGSMAVSTAPTPMATLASTTASMVLVFSRGRLSLSPRLIPPCSTATASTTHTLTLPASTAPTLMAATLGPLFMVATVFSRGRPSPSRRLTLLASTAPTPMATLASTMASMVPVFSRGRQSLSPRLIPPDLRQRHLQPIRLLCRHLQPLHVWQLHQALCLWRLPSSQEGGRG